MILVRSITFGADFDLSSTLHRVSSDICDSTFCGLFTYNI